MPRIVFTADPKLPADIKHLGYKKDMEVDLPLDQCQRWIRRGVAQFVTAQPRAKPVAETAKEPVKEEVVKEAAKAPLESTGFGLRTGAGPSPGGAGRTSR